MKLFFTVVLFLLVTISTSTIANGCFEVERDALLAFKAGLHDPGDFMSSWHDQDCCNWSGVICKKLSGYVVKLELRNPYVRVYPSNSNWVSHALTGEISPTLLSLRHLTHLDLSNHDFSTLSIPKFIGSFENLVYLNLSFSRFTSVIPNELGNLSRLQYLDLGYSDFTGLVPPQMGNLSDLCYLDLQYSYSYYQPSLPAIGSPSWLYHLSNLRYLDISGLWFYNRVDLSAINKKHMLQTLILSHCFSLEIPNDLSHINLTSLTKLDLSHNVFSVKLPNWLWNLTNLLYLDLGYSGFQGSIPYGLTNLVSLNYLSLGGNNFEHMLLEPISKLHNLRSLDLSFLGIEGDVVNLIKKLGYVWYNLESVNLAFNNLTGNIFSSITFIRNLSSIILSYNSLSGHITSEIGTLAQIKELNLSYNCLKGVITEAHFVNLSKLKFLDLSNNMLTLKTNDKWVPPFQLQVLSLSSCKVGPRFPSWLIGQKQLFNLMLFNTSIIGAAPNWFWNMPSLRYVDLSYNSITGDLPASFQSSKILMLNLRSNNISGPIPSIGGEMTQLILSKNRINGSIPFGICNMQDLLLLDLSDNVISGEIPSCWNNNSTLNYIDLSDNQITGKLPTSIGSLQYLNTLQLDNNKLYGEIPSTLQNCKLLIFLSLGRNNFSGNIPAWIGKQLQNLVVLQLRSNKFNGYIPPELGELGKLQILDLAHNSLIGPVPSSIGNFSSMKNSSQSFSSFVGFLNGMCEVTLYMVINGRQQGYTSMPLDFAKTIDISGNNLNGQIPKEIWLLEAVINLNLSKNHLKGEIPQAIGDMRFLESLDLSFNNFSGPIPQALSTLSSLHNLNLSYNNFFGKIPTGRQLDTLSDPSIYAGNSNLCGPPTDKNCPENRSSIGSKFFYDDNGKEMVWFCLAVALGFIIGFWSVWVVLFFRNVWRAAYFQMVDDIFDKIYVQIVLTMRRLG